MLLLNIDNFNLIYKTVHNMYCCINEIKAILNNIIVKNGL